MLWKKVEDYVKEHHMIRKGDRVLAACSGGADSVCLLRYLLQAGVDTVAVHVNHMLRDSESDRDEAYVRDLCRRCGVKLHIRRVDVAAEASRAKKGIEETGRSLRYALFEEVAEAEGCQKIATAHHADDQAETLLFRMARGTGLSGMRGISPVSGHVIRPLLCLEKEEILEILDALGQDYVTDSSNLTDDHSRNYLRNQVIPRIKEVNPAAVRHISRLAERVSQAQDYLSRQMGRVYEENVLKRGDGLLLGLSALSEMTEYEKREVLIRMIASLSEGTRDLGTVHIDQLLALADKPEGKEISLPFGLTAAKTREGILIGQGRKAEPEERVRETVIPKEEGDYRLPAGRGSLKVTVSDDPDLIVAVLSRDETKKREILKNDCVECFDYDRIKRHMCVRSRQSGDYIVIDAQGHRKKLRRYFVDRKIPEECRDQILLLADGSRILWVMGDRISEDCKLRENTKRVLCVQWTGGYSDGRQNQCINTGIRSRCESEGTGRADQ